jgi:hypothetical protein
MTNEHKAIIERHVSKMIEELGCTDEPPCWFPNNAEQIITNSIAAVLEFGEGTYEYLQKEDMVK